jgi:hypothetical protein
VILAVELVYPDLLKEFIESSNLREKYNTAPQRLETTDTDKITTILPLQTLIYADQDQQKLKSTLSAVQSVMNIDIGRVDISPDQNNDTELFSTIMKNNNSGNYGGDDAFMYIVEELIDNVYQHSRFLYGSFAAKVSDSDGFADLSVFDNGITIGTKFRESGMLFNQDSEAIVSAVNGLSSKMEPGRGFGLGSTVILVIDGFAGEVFIASGSGAVYASKYAKERYNFGRATKWDPSNFSCTSSVSTRGYLQLCMKTMLN